MLEVNQTRRLYLIVQKNLRMRDVRDKEAPPLWETIEQAERRIYAEKIQEDNEIRDAMNEIEGTREFFNEIKRCSDKEVINKKWKI